MKTVILLVALVFLIAAVVIIFTETKRDILGLALAMCVIAGYSFRIITSEDDI